MTWERHADLFYNNKEKYAKQHTNNVINYIININIKSISIINNL